MSDRNPFSRWDEDTEIHGLTLYDINREPRKISHQSTLTTIDVPNEIIASLLNDNLKCGVCLGLLDNTLATTCLHRFCSDCLHRALRMELGPKMHHECPSCRAKLASRRASKPDHKFNRLVEIFSGMKRPLEEIEGNNNGRNSPRGISPRNNNSSNSPRSNEESFIDLKKYRDIHRQTIAKFRQIRAQKLLTSSHIGAIGGNYSKGIVSKKTGNQQAGNTNYLDVQQNLKRKASSIGEDDGNNKVWLQISPLPEWSPDSALLSLNFNESATRDKTKFDLAHPFMRVPPYKTIISMKTYLLQKFGFENNDVLVDILGFFKNKMVVLEDNLSIADMTTKNWNAQSELILYFRFTAKGARKG